MSSQHSVLIVIDVQNGFVTENSQPVVSTIVDVVTRWQAAGGDVVFTRFHNYSGSPFERLINWTELHDQPDVDIIDDLQPNLARATAVVDKNFYTLFNDEGASLVAQRGWTDLYLCGIDTECCVLKTAVDCFERNLNPWILSDACASHSDHDSHDAGLFVASKFIGDGQIITTADIPYQFPSDFTEPVAH